MRLIRIHFPAVLALLLASFAALAAEPSTTLVWRGDLATSRSVMQDLAHAWRKAGHAPIKVQAFSTISGIDATLDGSADFAGSARPAFAKRKQEADLAFVPVAWDALVMIVHRKNPVHNVTLSQLRDIYYGKITNWKALGGPDRPINLYSVASPLDGVEYSLRRYLFRRGNQPVISPRLYINTSQLEAAVAIDPDGLGASTLSGVKDNAKLHMLKVQGISPSVEHVADGSYPLYEPLYLVTPAEGGQHRDQVEQFIGFANSDKGHALMRKNHLLPYDPGSPLASGMDVHLARMQDLSHPPMNGPVAAAGATYASRSATGPTSERTLEARQRLAAKRQREAAEKKTREENSQAARQGK